MGGGDGLGSGKLARSGGGGAARSSAAPPSCAPASARAWSDIPALLAAPAVAGGGAAAAAWPARAYCWSMCCSRAGSAAAAAPPPPAPPLPGGSPVYGRLACAASRPVGSSPTAAGRPPVAAPSNSRARCTSGGVAAYPAAGIPRAPPRRRRRAARRRATGWRRSAAAAAELALGHLALEMLLLLASELGLRLGLALLALPGDAGVPVLGVLRLELLLDASRLLDVPRAPRRRQRLPLLAEHHRDRRVRQVGIGRRELRPRLVAVQQEAVHRPAQPRAVGRVAARRELRRRLGAVRRRRRQRWEGKWLRQQRRHRRAARRRARAQRVGRAGVLLLELIPRVLLGLAGGAARHRGPRSAQTTQ